MEPTKNHIQQTINSLDGIEKATANPYLYDKVMNRMMNASQQVKPATLRMAFAIAVIVISVNVFSLLHFNHSASDQSNAFQKEYFSYITNF